MLSTQERPLKIRSPSPLPSVDRVNTIPEYFFIPDQKESTVADFEEDAMNVDDWDEDSKLPLTL